MNAFNVSWTSALSMTLLHSLWQGLIIALLTWMVLRLFHSRSSNFKYLVATGALFSLFTSVVITFFIIYTPQVENNAALSFSSLFAPSNVAEPTASVDYLKLVLDFLYLHQSWIVMGWAIGVLIFSLRFVAGITYLNYLRYRAVPVEQEWNEMLLRLSIQLKIKGVIELCESLAVHTPIVAGYLKPIVLMPVGLLSGLSMQQVEVILVHELAHIKRHDYLINFIQSLGETILFFNPFVWMISAWIRDERENCCDDMVLSEGYSPQLYAKTLFELETSREQTGRLALALTGNKNQLLNRIKRIMEHSTKNQNGKEKFIPLVLVVLGLVFASWLSINPNEEKDAMEQDSVKREAVADTTKKPKVTTYSRTTVITYDENGKPHEEVTESYTGDEDMPEPVAPPDFDFDIAEIAPVPPFDFNSAFDVVLAPPAMDVMGIAMPVSPMNGAPMTDFNFSLDTFPHGFSSFNEEQMRAFQDQFKEQFKAQFGDFYAKNQKELDKMMADTQKKMSEFDKQWADQMETRALYDMKRAQEMAQLAPISPVLEDKMHAATQQMKQAEMLARLSEDQARITEEQMRFNEEHVRKMEKNMKQFETEMKELLIKDGYIKSDESLKDIVFNPSGEISINGKKIKESDRKKYTDIHKKYFRHSDSHREEQ